MGAQVCRPEIQCCFCIFFSHECICQDGSSLPWSAGSRGKKTTSSSDQPRCQQQFLWSNNDGSDRCGCRVSGGRCFHRNVICRRSLSFLTMRGICCAWNERSPMCTILSDSACIFSKFRVRLHS